MRLIGRLPGLQPDAMFTVCSTRPGMFCGSSHLQWDVQHGRIKGLGIQGMLSL